MLTEVEAKYSEKYFKISLLQEAGASGENIGEKGTTKDTPKIKKIYILNIY